MKSFFSYDKFHLYFFFKVKNNLNNLITLFSISLFIFILFFILSKFPSILLDGHLSMFEKGISIVLLVSFIYSGIHCVGYVDHLFKSLTLYDDHLKNQTANKINNSSPSVAIIIPTLNEDPEMVKLTIFKAKNIDYPNYEVVLIDSSTEEDIRKKTAQMSSDFNIRYIYRDNLRGYKAGSVNDALEEIGRDYRYALILDSDHRLKGTVLRDLIPIMENNQGLSFIQTPQYFSSSDRLGLAYSFQQHVFYKHICRGLCINGSSYICGTNVLIKLDDLKEIGGMDETCITEDIATSFTFHSKGYKSIYVDRVYAEGLTPPSLSAYYGQQLRWSYGTFQNTKKVLGTLIKQPKCMKSLQWWEYLILNGSWYFIGIGIFIWLLYPVFIILFNLQPIVLGPLNIPFYIFFLMILSQTLTSVWERGYPLRDLILAQALFFSLFPVYTKALILGLTNKKLKFKVTPKKNIYKVNSIDILPHITLIVLLTLSIIVGIYKLQIGENTSTYPSIIFWASYSLLMLILFMMYFYKEDINKYQAMKTI